VHLAGAAVAGWALWSGARRFLRLPDLVSAILVAAMGINGSGFLFGTLVFNARSAREMVAVLPFGAALAARRRPGTLLAGQRDHAGQRRPGAGEPGLRGRRQVHRGQMESRAAWYDPRQRVANFLIVGGTAFCDDATAAQARSVLGIPAHSYRIGPYTVMVWQRNLLTAVR